MTRQSKLTLRRVLRPQVPHTREKSPKPLTPLTVKEDRAAPVVLTAVEDRDPAGATVARDSRRGLRGLRRAASREARGKGFEGQWLTPSRYSGACRVDWASGEGIERLAASLREPEKSF